MNNDKVHCDEGVLIGRNLWDEPMLVPLSAYLQFSREMDVRLRRLVACWNYAAAPIAREATRTFGQRRIKNR